MVIWPGIQKSNWIFGWVSKIHPNHLSAVNMIVWHWYCLIFSVCQILEMPKISLGVMMQPIATEPNNPCTPGVSVFLRHLRGQFGCCKKEENQVWSWRGRAIGSGHLWLLVCTETGCRIWNDFSTIFADPAKIPRNGCISEIQLK